jgi:ABC-type transport system involved in multi-copper enzyme maturation permease subunit
MSSSAAARALDTARLVALSARLLAGRRFWLAPLLPLLWLAALAIVLIAGWQAESYEAVHAQNVLIGLPLTLLAIGLGTRVIAGDMDRRTLEITYTVPGGSHRVWLGKLAAAVLLLLAAEALLAVGAYVFFTSYPPSALYGAFQAAVFYLVAAMGFAALFKSEITGAMATAALLGINGVITGFGEMQPRSSPLFNPLAIYNAAPGDLFAWTLQNRIGFALVIAVVIALAFARAERREKLLGGS